MAKLKYEVVRPWAHDVEAGKVMYIEEGQLHPSLVAHVRLVRTPDAGEVEQAESANEYLAEVDAKARKIISEATEAAAELVKAATLQAEAIIGAAHVDAEAIKAAASKK
jgi:hypothetical protein